MKKIIIICNAVDDITRNERKITTDSPAASKKVFMLADALADANTHLEIISMGRGRPNNSFNFYMSKKIINKSVEITYLPFTHIRFLSELITFFYLAIAMVRAGIGGGYSDRAVIFYNRLPAYILALVMASFLGLKRIIDIEDGEIASAGKKNIKQKINYLVIKLYDFLCTDGALLACSALSSMTRNTHKICYYGTVSALSKSRFVFNRAPISVLLSGSLSDDTGANRLVNAIRSMRLESARWENIRFDISGHGPSLQDFRELMEDNRFPSVYVHGRLSNTGYNDLLEKCDVGLALKPISGSLADTTFPSKVVEFASAGLLVVSTDISDVKLVLGVAGAAWLSTDCEEELIKTFDNILLNTRWAKDTLCRGRKSVCEKLDPASVQKKIREFIFPDSCS